MTAASAVTEKPGPHREARTTAQVLAFRRPAAAPASAANRLTLRDRLELAQWETVAFAHGFTRVAIDTSASDGCGELGDFASLYRKHSGWASWCVGCARGGFTVWRLDGPETVGWYPTLRLALDAVLADQPACVAAT